MQWQYLWLFLLSPLFSWAARRVQGGGQTEATARLIVAVSGDIPMRKMLMITDLTNGGIAVWTEHFVRRTRDRFSYYLVTDAIDPSYGAGSGLDAPNVEVVTAPILSLRSGFGARGIAAAIRRLRPDHLVCHGLLNAVSAVLARALSLTSIPFTLIVHANHSHEDSNPLAWRTVYACRILRLLMRKGDRVVAVSPYVRDYLASTPLRVFPTEVIYNGIETDLPGEPVPALPNGNCKRLGYVGGGGTWGIE